MWCGTGAVSGRWSDDASHGAVEVRCPRQPHQLHAAAHEDEGGSSRRWCGGRGAVALHVGTKRSLKEVEVGCGPGGIRGCRGHTGGWGAGGQAEGDTGMCVGRSQQAQLLSLVLSSSHDSIL